MASLGLHILLWGPTCIGRTRVYKICLAKYFSNWLPQHLRIFDRLKNGSEECNVRPTIYQQTTDDFFSISKRLANQAAFPP